MKYLYPIILALIIGFLVLAAPAAATTTVTFGKTGTYTGIKADDSVAHFLYNVSLARAPVSMVLHSIYASGYHGNATDYSGKHALYTCMNQGPGTGCYFDVDIAVSNPQACDLGASYPTWACIDLTYTFSNLSQATLLNATDGTAIEGTRINPDLYFNLSISYTGNFTGFHDGLSRGLTTYAGLPSDNMGASSAGSTVVDFTYQNAFAGSAVNISGITWDKKNLTRLSGVTVTATEGTITETTTSNANGEYNITDLLPGTFNLTGSKGGYFTTTMTVNIPTHGDFTGDDLFLDPVPADYSTCSVGFNVRDARSESLIGGATGYIWDYSKGYNKSSTFPYGGGSFFINQTDSADTFYVNGSAPGYIGQWVGTIGPICGSLLTVGLLPVNQSSTEGNCTAIFKVRDYQAFTTGIEKLIPGASITITDGQTGVTDGTGAALFHINASKVFGFNVSMPGYNSYSNSNSCGGYSGTLVPVYLVQGSYVTVTPTPAPGASGSECQPGDTVCAEAGLLAYFIRYSPQLGALLFVVCLVGLMAQAGKSIKALMK